MTPPGDMAAIAARWEISGAAAALELAALLATPNAAALLPLLAAALLLLPLVLLLAVEVEETALADVEAALVPL